MSVFLEMKAEPLTDGFLLLLSDVKLIYAIFSTNLFQPTGSALVSLADSNPYLSNLYTNLVALEFLSVSEPKTFAHAKWENFRETSTLTGSFSLTDMLVRPT